MTLETLLRDASILQLTEALLSKSHQIHPQPSGHMVGTVSPELQDIVKPELPERLTSPHELTNTLRIATSRISSAINKTQLISRLPPEVLALVFDWYQRFRFAEPHNRWYLWVHLMSVSQAWRSTILSFPSLWSTIYMGNKLPPKVFRTLLQRSGNHPLDIIVPERHGSVSRVVRYSNAREASAHMSRVRTLFLHENSGEKDLKDILKIFSKPAPNLVHLRLLVFRPRRPISLPDWFGMDFPKLRSLEVTGSIAWPEAIGTNLTHIHITPPFNPLQLKLCIPYSPSLRTLQVQGIRDILSTSHRVTLPAGIHLTIKDSLMCPKLVGIFALPSDGRLRVEPSLLSGWGPARSFLFWVLPFEPDHLPNMRTITRLHMNAPLDTRMRLEVKCFRQDLAVFEAKIEFDPDKLGPTTWDVSPAMRFLDNLDGIVLREVKELRMEGFFGSLQPHLVELLNFLERMPALVRVVTTEYNEEDFRSALDILGCQATVVRVDRQSPG